MTIAILQMDNDVVIHLEVDRWTEWCGQLGKGEEIFLDSRKEWEEEEKYERKEMIRN